MATNQNIIFSSVINFDYHTTAAAKRGNDLIESIFSTQVLPDIDKAISAKIPEGIRVELSKLEINIGDIYEKELETSLAERIRIALEKALNMEFDHFTGTATKTTSSAVQQVEMQYIDAFEFFLVKGYFPFDFGKTFSFDELTQQILKKNREELRRILFQYRNNNPVLERFAYNLASTSLPEVLNAVDSVNRTWITEFIGILKIIKNELNLNHISDNDFIRQVNFLFLHRLLANTSLTLNKKDFAAFVLSEVSKILKIDFNTLNGVLTQFSDNSQVTTIIHDVLNESAEYRSQSEVKMGQIPELSTIIKWMNEGKTIYGQWSLNELKDSLLHLLRHPENIKFLTTGLNETGRSFLIRLFNRETSPDLIELLQKITGENQESIVKTDSDSKEKQPEKIQTFDVGEITGIILKYQKSKEKITQIVKQLNEQSFTKILSSIDSVNAGWIIEFQQMLFFIKTELKIDWFTESEWKTLVNRELLLLLLQNTSQLLNKADFTFYFLTEVFRATKFNAEYFSAAIEKFPENEQLKKLVLESVGRISKEKIENRESKTQKQRSVEQIIDALNRGNIEFESQGLDILKTEIIVAMEDKISAGKLAKNLSDHGLKVLLNLYRDIDSPDFFELIQSFTVKLGKKYSSTFQNASQFARHLIFQTILYTSKSTLRKLSKEEFIIFLLTHSEIDTRGIEEKAEFREFIQSVKNIQPAKTHLLIAEENRYHEISSIKKVISANGHSQELTAGAAREKSKSEAEYISIFKKKLIQFYLDKGYLTRSYSALNRKEVQDIFFELLTQKDDFLAELIKTTDDSETLLNHIYRLTGSSISDFPDEYLVHFFPEAYRILSLILENLTQEFHLPVHNPINTLAFRNKVFIVALTESKGNILQSVFQLSAIRLIWAELVKHGSVGELQLQDFLTVLKPFPDVKTHSDSKEPDKHFDKSELISAFQNNLYQLIRTLQDFSFGDWSARERVFSLVEKVVFFAKLFPQDFIQRIQNTKRELPKLFFAIKLFLPKNQGQEIEKMLLSQVEIENEIERMIAFSNVALNGIKDEEIDISWFFQRLNQLDAEESATFISFLTLAERKLGGSVSHEEFHGFIHKLDFKHQKFATIIQLLSDVSLGTLSLMVDLNFWRITVLEFGLQLVENQTSSIKEFSGLFFNHLNRKLKSIGQSSAFYEIVQMIKLSGNKELAEMVAVWQSSKPGVVIEDSTFSPEKSTVVSDKPVSAEPIFTLEKYLVILRFYALHGFMPWWAGQITFHELVEKILEQRLSSSANLEESFIHMDKEDQILEKLAGKLTQSQLVEMTRLFDGLPDTKSRWEHALEITGYIDAKTKTDGFSEPESVLDKNLNTRIFIEKAAQNDDILFKGAYLFEDEHILSDWLPKAQPIKEQISAYLKLAPFFHYRNFKQNQWRQMVYRFSLDYYTEKDRTIKKDFHLDFLRFIRNQQKLINWNEVLKSVYQLVQQQKPESNAKFPQELARLLNLTKHSLEKSDVLNLKTTETISVDTENYGEMIKISNSGIILFWPFLTRLFESLSLVKDGSFINSNARNRAVYILQNLAYNQIDFPEYELVLNKILVGMPSEEHLIPFITLTQEETDLSNSLLNGLILNWEKVKNSSPEGIQTTFIQREGIIKFGMNEITLEVEKKGVDVLMNSIPWNISLIKLAWMKKPLYVNWV